MTKIPIVA